MPQERTYKASTYLSPDEIKQIRIAAGYAGVSVSEYLRIAAMERATQEERKRNPQTSNQESEHTS